jgi:hypothetical protein
MSGCAVCVYDLYEESLRSYKESIATLRTALEARGVPEAEWPADIRAPGARATGSGPSESATRNVALDAFEEMERALAAKRAKAESTTS